MAPTLVGLLASSLLVWRASASALDVPPGWSATTSAQSDCVAGAADACSSPEQRNTGTPPTGDICGEVATRVGQDVDCAAVAQETRVPIFSGCDMTKMTYDQDDWHGGARDSIPEVGRCTVRRYGGGG
jgi:hypothetical protein